MSFRLKTILGIALIEIIMLGLLLHFGLKLLHDTSANEVAKRSQSTVQLFARAVRNAILSTDLATLQQASSEMAADPEVRYVRIISNGQVLAQAGNPNELAQAFNANQHFDVDSVDGTLDREAIIRIADQEIGRVQLGFSVGTHLQLLSEARQGGLTIAGSEIILTAFISILLGMYLTRQLKRLSKAAEAIRSGEIGYQIPVHGNDELADTAKAFNQMSQQLAESYQQMMAALLSSQSSTITLQQRESELVNKQKVLDAINALQRMYIGNTPRLQLFEEALNILLALTGARVGLISEYQSQEHQLCILSLSDISWNAATRDLFTKHREGQPIFFRDMHNMLGQPVLTRQPILHNEPFNEHSRIPEGHPPLDNYLGIPILIGNEVIGTVGLANHPHGFSGEQLELLSPLLQTLGQLILAWRNKEALGQALNTLQQSEEQLRSVVDTSIDGILTINQHGLIQSANRAVQAIFTDGQQMVGRNFLSLLAEEYRDDYQQALARFTPGCESWIIGQLLEVHATRSSGQRFPAELAMTAMSLGPRVLFNVVIRDISRRKLAESQIRQLSNELKTILDLSPDGFLAFDQHARISYANPALLTMLGYKEAELLHLDLAELDALQQSYSHDPASYLPTQSLNDGDADKLTLALPTRRTLKRSLRLQQDDRGHANGGIVYYRDMTREAEVDRMKTEFLSTAAHELRTPMASILGFSELLLNREFDAETRKDLLETIHRQSCNLVELVNQLLDLARIEARAGTDFRITPLPLSALLTERLANFATPAGRTPPQYDAPLPAERVMVDADKFGIALNNVLSNAYKYSPQGGDVRIRLQYRDAQGTHPAAWGISVSDQGIGIPGHLRHKVFERFYRVDSSGNIPGTGLGLSLVKEIMDNLHGDVQLESEAGKGSCITLWLNSATGTDHEPAHPAHD